MGAFCCKEQRTTEKVLTQDTLAHHLVRSKKQEITDKYDVVELIGKGSISTISKIRRVPCDSAQDVKDKEETITSPTNLPIRGYQKSESIDANPINEFYALKEIDMTMISQVTVEELKNEIDILSSLVSLTFSNENEQISEKHIF
jgi:hypothetical protein